MGNEAVKCTDPEFICSSFGCLILNFSGPIVRSSISVVVQSMHASQLLGGSK
jgi:hypothetical protein